jgi:hypothetical protein
MLFHGRFGDPGEMITNSASSNVVRIHVQTDHSSAGAPLSRATAFRSAFRPTDKPELRGEYMAWGLAGASGRQVDIALRARA